MQNDFQNDYTIGRGKSYFDKFLPNTNRKTGEMYFGNGPEFTITTDTENLDHYASDYGLRVKDASVLLEAGMTGTFTCDNIAAENLRCGSWATWSTLPLPTRPARKKYSSR